MATKVMVSFPDEFLAQVDRVAKEEQRSRSELIREALRLYMGRRRARGRSGADPQGQPAIGVQDRLPRAAAGNSQDSTADVSPSQY